jgi:hypothetical protein
VERTLDSLGRKSFENLLACTPELARGKQYSWDFYNITMQIK